jgi:hypothetical protein
VRAHLQQHCSASVYIQQSVQLLDISMLLYWPSFWVCSKVRAEHAFPGNQ